MTMQNVEAEETLLGILLVNNQAYDRVYSHVRTEDFYVPVHARIYDEIAVAINAGQVADPVMLKSVFQGDPALEQVGGAKYLAQLARNAGPAVNATDYAREIARMAKLRQIEDLGSRMQEMAKGASKVVDIDGVMDEIASELFELGGKAGEMSNIVSLADTAQKSREATELILKNGGKVDGLKTGFYDLDKLIGGMGPGRMIVVAGRPAMGKTAFALNIAEHVARGGRKVGIFTLEMTALELTQRMEAAAVNIPVQRLTEHALNQQDFEKYCVASKELGNAPMYFYDKGTVTIDTLCMNIRRMRKHYGIELAVVDYLQKITPGRGQNRYEMVTEASSKISALAKDLGIPIILLSQLSRQVEQRDDKQPTMADLRESGQIEQDAFQVIFLYREHYYLQLQPKSPNQKGYDEWVQRCDATEHLAKAIIGKNRSGRTGDVILQFNGAVTKFSNYQEATG